MNGSDLGRMVLVLILVCVTADAAVAATTDGGQSSDGRSCRAAFDRACGHVRPQAGSVMRCLQSKQPVVSAPCRDLFNGNGVARATGVIDACMPDVRRICAAASSEEELEHCVMERVHEFSPACKQRLALLPVDVCRPDVQRHCASDPEVTRPLSDCIELHREALAEACGQPFFRRPAFRF